MADLILASASRSRQAMLEAAGIRFRTMAAGVDEAATKRCHKSTGTGLDELALSLAIQKALAVARQFPSSVVIGADQVLGIEGEALDKPDDPETARRQLLRLRGRTHNLHTAVACARDEKVLWSQVEVARLEMREFSSEFLEMYLSKEGQSVTESVGGYKIEGYGLQLFQNISGDYFTILGLPLLPLLAFLRAEGVIGT